MVILFVLLSTWLFIVLSFVFYCLFTVFSVDYCLFVLHLFHSSMVVLFVLLSTWLFSVIFVRSASFLFIDGDSIGFTFDLIIYCIVCCVVLSDYCIVCWLLSVRFASFLFIDGDSVCFIFDLIIYCNICSFCIFFIHRWWFCSFYFKTWLFIIISLRFESFLFIDGESVRFVFERSFDSVSVRHEFHVALCFSLKNFLSVCLINYTSNFRGITTIKDNSNVKGWSPALSYFTMH